MYAQIDGARVQRVTPTIRDTICVYAQIDGIDGCLFVHVKSDTICTYTQIDGSWATLTLICVSTRSVYVQVDKNNK